MKLLSPHLLEKWEKRRIVMTQIIKREAYFNMPLDITRVHLQEEIRPDISEFQLLYIHVTNTSTNLRLPIFDSFRQ
jgi:hypothetical protein